MKCQAPDRGGGGDGDQSVPRIVNLLWPVSHTQPRLLTVLDLRGVSFLQKRHLFLSPLKISTYVYFSFAFGASLKSNLIEVQPLFREIAIKREQHIHLSTTQKSSYITATEAKWPRFQVKTTLGQL